MMTDPIADMLTRLRNANRTESPAVDMPSTNVKTQIAQVLKEEGFIIDFQVGKMAATEEGRLAFQTPADDNGPEEDPARVPQVRSGRGTGHSAHRTAQQARPAALQEPQGAQPVLDGLGFPSSAPAGAS